MASFGDSLRRERELRGIVLRDVADATKISLRFLQALESDRIDILPGGIFPRAFVRQYAAYLGLDADRKVAEFLYHFGNQSPAATAPPRAPARSRAPVLLGVAAAIVLVGLAAWGFARWRERAPAESVPVSPPGSTFPPDRLYPPPAPTSPPGAALPAVQGLVLGLSAHQTCWVAVQADGKKVVDRVMNQGETESVTANDELVLSVGNAGGISFSVNGRPGISVGEEGVVRRNILITRQSLPSLLQESVPPPAAGPAATTAPPVPSPRIIRPRPPTPSPSGTAPPPDPASPAPATSPVPSPEPSVHD